MADSAQAEPGTAMSPIGIKQEQSLPDFPDLSAALQSFASKRPLDASNHNEGILQTSETEPRENGDHDSQPHKKVKTEHNEVEQQQNAQPSFEDDMDLLVANALSGADLLQEFSERSATQAPSVEPMDLEPTSLAEPPRIAPDFDIEPVKCLRTRSIRALGNLSMSLLLILTRSPVEDALNNSRSKDTSQAQTLTDLSTAYYALRRLYGSNDMLSAVDTGLDDAESQSIMHLSNLAQFGLWLCESTKDSLSKAINSFWTAAPQVDLAPEVAELYLSLRTQFAIEGLATKDPSAPNEEVLQAAFSDGLEQNLRTRHEGQELPVPEQLLMTSIDVRRAAFPSETPTAEGLIGLRTSYPMTQLSRNFATYVRQEMSTMTDLADKLGLALPADDHLPQFFDNLPEANIVADIDMDDMQSFFEKTAAGLVQNALAGVSGEEDGTNANGVASATADATGTAESEAAPRTNSGRGEYEELQALVAQSTSDYVKNTLNSLSPATYQLHQSSVENMASQGSLFNHYQNQQNYQSFAQGIPEAPPPPPAIGDSLPPNQSCSSAALYDKARQAALSKSSAHTRREGLNGTRRPWTQDEEKALMAGLDMVKGPHWSQILTLFGQHGTISDILKDRTQVQLKDKARNLKLFFLKTNSEMPYYLQAVTGELKTRAPTQAARKEAEERARLNSEEDQAKVQGIMALSGLQYPAQQLQPAQSAHLLQNSQQRAPNQALRGPGSSINTPAMTPAQAAAQATGTPNNSGHMQQGVPGVRSPAMPSPGSSNQPHSTSASGPIQQQAAVQGTPRPAAQTFASNQQPGAPRPGVPQQPQNQQNTHVHAHPQRATTTPQQQSTLLTQQQQPQQAGLGQVQGSNTQARNLSNPQPGASGQPPPHQAQQNYGKTPSQLTTGGHLSTQANASQPSLQSSHGSSAPQRQSPSMPAQGVARPQTGQPATSSSVSVSSGNANGLRQQVPGAMTGQPRTPTPTQPVQRTTPTAHPPHSVQQAISRSQSTQPSNSQRPTSGHATPQPQQAGSPMKPSTPSRLVLPQSQQTVSTTQAQHQANQVATHSPKPASQPMSGTNRPSTQPSHNVPQPQEPTQPHPQPASAQAQTSISPSAQPSAPVSQPPQAQSAPQGDSLVPAPQQSAAPQHTALSTDTAARPSTETQDEHGANHVHDNRDDAALLQDLQAALATVTST